MYSFTIFGNADLCGEYEAVLSVSDEYGATSEYVMNYELLSNISPILNQQIENTILSSLGEMLRISLTDCFDDPDNGELQYEVYLSDSSILELSRDNDAVLLNAIDYGITEIIVTASDSYGESVELRFKVAVKNGSETLAYPNPVTDFLNISSSDSGTAKVRIVSQSGILEYEKDLPLDPFRNIRIDLRELSPGIYHLSLNGENVCVEQQLLKL